MWCLNGLFRCFSNENQIYSWLLIISVFTKQKKSTWTNHNALIIQLHVQLQMADNCTYLTLQKKKLDILQNTLQYSCCNNNLYFKFSNFQIPIKLKVNCVYNGNKWVRNNWKINPRFYLFVSLQVKLKNNWIHKSIIE